MIKIECDNCERTFEVENDLAGGKTPCPFCEDVNRVPAAPEPREKAMPTGNGDDEEREICVIRPGMFRARPFRYLLIFLLFFGGGIGAGYVWFRQDLNNALAIPALLVSGFGLIWFGSWWMSTHFWVKLIVTNKRSIRHEGIIKRHTTEVLHDHIRSVDIRQTLLNRILSIGDLDIDSAGQGGDRDIEIEMKDIPHPYEVKKIIDQYRKM